MGVLGNMLKEFILDIRTNKNLCSLYKPCIPTRKSLLPHFGIDWFDVVPYLYLDDGLTSQLDQNSHPSHVPTDDYLHMDGTNMMVMIEEELGKMM